ncbi:MAG: VOC family protein [Polyangiaceae bacterium]|nr:VOC family protein [Polyangiaceae bacterium]
MSTVDKHIPGTVAWYDLMTPNLEGARKFYEGLFGWTYEVGPAETGFYTMCRIGDRNAAGMGQQPENAPFPSAWNCYFQSESADADVARVKENGGQVMMGPMDVMEEGRLAFCMDPTGAAFGLWQSKRHQGAGVINQHGAMTWSEVCTRDAVKARDFYSAVFGLEGRKIDASGMEYYTLHKGDATAAGVLQMNERFPAEIPPHWMPYFAVNKVDDTVKKVNELGGKVLNGPFDSPYGRIAVVADPFGAAFSVIQLSHPAA